MLTVVEVAAILRVSRTCVYQLIESGKIACHRIGVGRGAIRVAQSDLDEFVVSCRQEPDKGASSAPSPAKRLKHLRQ
jgi:excisionase family DNA binding protein